MKTVICLVFILFLNFFSDLHIITTVPVKADKIYADEFDNLYLISGNSLIKYNSEGKKLFVYDSSYGEKISSVDISDPLKILIFFKDQNRIVFTDNKLSPTGNEIYLENKNIFGNVLICKTESGGIWIFDTSNRMLIKYDSDFKEIFRKSLFEINTMPNYMIAEGNLLYLKTENNFVFVYDNLGNFDFTINRKITSDFFTKGKIIQYFNKKEKSLISYNFETGDSVFIRFPDSLSVQNAVQSSHYLYFNDKSNVYVSKIVNERKDKQ